MANFHFNCAQFPLQHPDPDSNVRLTLELHHTREYASVWMSRFDTIKRATAALVYDSYQTSAEIIQLHTVVRPD